MISVVIPTKNEAGNLPRLLNALGSQTLPPDEVIVVDGRSTDSTVEIARNHGCEVYLGESSIGRARDFGTLKAGGDIVVQTDGDAYPKTNYWLETLTAPIREGDAIITTGNLHDPGPVFDHLLNPHLKLWGTLLGQVGQAPAANMAFRRSAYLRTRGFPDVSSAEDLELIRRMKKVGKHVHVDSRDAETVMEVNPAKWAKGLIEEYLIK